MIGGGLLAVVCAAWLSPSSLEPEPAQPPRSRSVRERILAAAIDQGRAAITSYRRFLARGGPLLERAAQMDALQAAMDGLNRELDENREPTSLAGSPWETSAEEVMGRLAECMIELESEGRGTASPTPGHGVGDGVR